MLGCLATLAHGVWVPVEALLYGLQHILMLPARDSSFLASAAALFDSAAQTSVGPVTEQNQPILLVCVVVDELLSGRTNVNVLLSHIAEVLLAEAPLCLNAGGYRFGKRHGDAGLVASEDLPATEVAAIGNRFEFLDAERRLRLASDVCELCSIRTIIRYCMRDNQVMFRIDRNLHVVADHARAASAGRHRAAVWISERDLLVGGCQHQLLLQMRRLRRQLFRWLLQVGRVEVRKIARHAFLQLGAASFHLPAREVLVAGID